MKNVASVLKSFFRKLPDPLFTDEYYEDFIQTTHVKDESQRMRKIRQLLIGLPQHHYRQMFRNLNTIADVMTGCLYAVTLVGTSPFRTLSSKRGLIYDHVEHAPFISKLIRADFMIF